MRKDTLLIELGTEELPPKALSNLANSFAEQFAVELEKAKLGFERVNWFASPRRLAVRITGLEAQQQDTVIEKRGPAVTAAFDADGSPTKAAEGWARSNGISVAEAERLITDKGEWLLHKAEVKGQALQQLLQAMVTTAVSKLPIPKPMRWGSKSVQFIRPVHTLCALYGEEAVDIEVLGIRSGTELHGHRFHGTPRVTLQNAEDYLTVLRQNFVLADYQERKETIRSELQRIATEHDAQVTLDEGLLDEVTSLVEWPVALTATFDESFLAVPKEALIYTMKDDQKYFPLLDNQGNLLPKFIFVSNIESKDPQQVIAGNEKVVRPRLADAEFFFNTDKKTSLDSRLPALGNILFQKQLGTLQERSERISSLAAYIADSINADRTHAARAGQLAKADLVSNMVLEFPEVQGVMGKYYALAEGEPAEVAQAIEDQYKPKFAGDELPNGPVGMSVALADKLDTLVGIFGIGQLPKGDKDPFALRRAAIGILRIIVEGELPLDLTSLIEHAASLYGDKLSNGNVVTASVDFILGRFKTWYQDQGVDTQVIQSVLVRRPTAPADFDARIKAVQHFMTLSEAQSLAAANKRVANILSKNSVESNQVDYDKSVLSESAELALVSAFEELQSSVDAKSGYQQMLANLASLKEPVDAFFDSVMVMAEDEKVRENRLALLNSIRSEFLKVADISVIG